VQRREIVPPPPVPPKPEELKKRAEDDVELNAKVEWVLQDIDVRLLKGKEREVPPPPIPSKEELDFEAAKDMWLVDSADGSPGPSRPSRSNIAARRAAREALIHKENSAKRSANSFGNEGYSRD
jgi:hypothetical protein